MNWVSNLLIPTVFCSTLAVVHAAPPLPPVVEAEDDLYRYEPADNGAGPMWCSGSTCLVRIGERVFASGLETLAQHQPLNNCRWQLFQHGADGWELQQADPNGRTREPCPIVAFPDGRLFLSAKKELTGRDWDYDFRRLFFTWSEGTSQGKFHNWIEIVWTC